MAWDWHEFSLVLPAVGGGSGSERGGGSGSDDKLSGKKVRLDVPSQSAFEPYFSRLTGSFIRLGSEGRIVESCRAMPEIRHLHSVRIQLALQGYVGYHAKWIHRRYSCAPPSARAPSGARYGWTYAGSHNFSATALTHTSRNTSA